MGVPFRLLAAPAMPPPSASDEATRLANYWVVHTIAGDDSLDFSVLSELVAACPEMLEGAPEATRERVARRCLLQLSSMIAARGDAAANAARVTRVDGARSCQDVLFQITREAVGNSGKVEKDLLLPFIEDIQEAICTKIPETTIFDLLERVAVGLLKDTAGLGT